MSPDTLSTRTIRFVNIAHALDHFVLLIYPMAVLAIATETALPYGTLIGLSTGAFVAFGLFSLPMGWLADRFGRRILLAVFFAGTGVACLGLTTAASPVAFAIWLVVLGVFAAIYHPIGSAMLVSHTRRLGHDLGINGVAGNFGAAFAAGITAFLTVSFGWRAAFAVPGLVCLACAAAFLILVPSDGEERTGPRGIGATAVFSRPRTLLLLFALAIIAGGMTFNMLTIALPKLIEERVTLDLPLWVVGSLATTVFVFGAVAQLVMGRLIDRFPLPVIFLMLSVLQPLGLGIAAIATDVPMLVGLVLAMTSIYGQVVVNDAMVARYVSAAWRSRAFSVRYFLGFTTSGFAVPLIALCYDAAGFPLVMAVASAFGVAIVVAALAFLAVARPGPAGFPAAAE